MMKRLKLGSKVGLWEWVLVWLKMSLLQKSIIITFTYNKKFLPLPLSLNQNTFSSLFSLLSSLHTVGEVGSKIHFENGMGICAARDSRLGSGVQKIEW